MPAKSRYPNESKKDFQKRMKAKGKKKGKNPFMSAAKAAKSK